MYTLKRIIAKLLHRLHLYSQHEMCCMIEEVANDFRHHSDITRFVRVEYQSVYFAIQNELINAALLSDDECHNDCTCESCV